jgi:hypothetical protein
MPDVASVLCFSTCSVPPLSISPASPLFLSVSFPHHFRAIPGRYEVPAERIQKRPSTEARVIAEGFVYELTSRIGPLHSENDFS